MHNYNSFDVKPKIAVDLDNKVKPFKLLNNVVYLSRGIEEAEKLGKSKAEPLNFQASKLLIYRIVINKGYTWNGANIPRIFWRIIGSQFNPEFLPASMIHDWLCEHKNFIIQNGVKVSSDIFRDILVLYGVSKFKANVMANAVRLFQYTQKGWK